MSFDFQERTNKILGRLRLLGIWFKHDILHFDLYLVYSIVIFITHNLHILAQTIYISNHYDELSELISSGLLTLVEIFTNLKTYCVYKNKNKILKINDVVLKQSFQPRNSYQEELVMSTIKIFDVMYMVHVIGPALCVLLFGLYPIADIRDNNRKLPFNAWYPFDFKKSPYYELSYIHQMISCIVSAQTQVNVDCLCLYFIVILVVQLDLLADNLRNISEKVDEKMEMHLFSCIKHHMDILSCFSEVYQILNIIMFGQFLLSTTLLCLTLLELSVISPASTQFLALFVYIVALMIELLLFSWWGNQLMIKSQALPQAAFESGWVDGTVSYKKKLTFFIFRTQKDLVLYAVDFFKISLGSFLLILKNSYSFYAVLRHVNANEQNEK